MALDAVSRAGPAGCFLAEDFLPFGTILVPSFVGAKEGYAQLLVSDRWWQVVEEMKVAIESERGEYKSGWGLVVSC